jgi:sulfopyruvate decarboxylase TPP-binding subunit
MTWSDPFLGILKDNDVRLVSYVPDNVLTPLIKGVTADNYSLAVCATREDEAIGTVTGAYMAGLRGVVMMQTSGFALLANSLASLVMPYQIPAIDDQPGKVQTVRDPALIRNRFMKGLGTGRGGALDA